MAAAKGNNNPARNGNAIIRTAEQQKKYDTMAILFAVGKMMQSLEKEYLGGRISRRSYVMAFGRWLVKYNWAIKGVLEYTDHRRFLDEFELVFPAAISRLRSGHPSPIEDKELATRRYEEIVSLFVKLEKKVWRNVKSRDQLRPDLLDLQTKMHQLGLLGVEFEGFQRIGAWLKMMDNMGPYSEITESQLRRLMFDLERSRYAFYKELRWP